MQAWESSSAVLRSILIPICIVISMHAQCVYAQPAVTAGPVLVMNPSGAVPLVGVVTMSTNTPAFASLTVTDDRNGRGFRVEFPDPQTEHALQVLGLKPERTYTIAVAAAVTRGGAPFFTAALHTQTGPLPSDFPTLELLASDPAEIEPGLILLDRAGTYMMVVDQQGEVVWYSTVGGQDAQLLPDGNVLALRPQACPGCGVPFVMDLLGNVLAQLRPAGETEPLHHDVFPTENGTLLTLGFSSALVTDFPASETDPLAVQTTVVRDEPIIEYLPTGEVIRKHFLQDIIDPRRIGYDSLQPTDQGVDWVHANAVLYDARDDSIVVSLRSQDAVVKFARQTGELIWILANHENWNPAFEPYLLKPVGRFRWQYHQHAPMWTPQGTLLLFDNGNHRTSPFDGKPKIADKDNYSRAVEYAIDEQTMEVRQVWEWVSDIKDGVYDETLYAGFIGDADWMGVTGNVLITFGGVSFTGGVPNEEIGRGQVSTRIIEVEHVLGGKRVFDLAVHHNADGVGARTAVYRSEKIRSLYPFPVETIP